MKKSITQSTYQWPGDTVLKPVERPQPPPSPYLANRKHPFECRSDCAHHNKDVLIYQKLQNKELYYKMKSVLPKWQSIYQRDYALTLDDLGPEIWKELTNHPNWGVINKTFRDDFTFNIVAHPLPKSGRPCPVTFVPDAAACGKQHWPELTEYQDTISKDGLFYVKIMQQHRCSMPITLDN